MSSAPYISTQNMSHADWLKARQKGIGGSDAAAVLGLIPQWKTPLEVYEEKVADEPIDTPATPAMQAGKAMENVIARWWAEEAGLSVVRDNKVRFHPWISWLLVDLDRVIRRKGRPGVLECKNVGTHMVDFWQADIPIEVYAQVQHGLLVTGFEWGEVAVCLGTREFRRYPIEPDSEWMKEALDAYEDFWQGHVVPRIVPELTTEREIRRLYPAIQGKVLESSAHLNILVQLAKASKERLDALGKEQDRAELQIKLAMKDAEVVAFEDNPIVTWKLDRVGRRSVDYQKLKQNYLDAYTGCVTVGEPARRFLYK